jgi:hypothetical protein
LAGWSPSSKSSYYISYEVILTPQQQVQFFDFTKNKNLWTYGEFAGESINGSIPVDPWSSTGRKNTPFDESFYLILNVAVGGTNGWFP